MTPQLLFNLTGANRIPVGRHESAADGEQKASIFATRTDTSLSFNPKD